MKIRVLTALLGALAWTTPAVAQDKVVTGKVSREAGVPLSGVTVIVKGTNTSTQTNQSGDYSIRVSVGQTLQYRL
ncbi:MAG: carboxypeptidase-like regulatory domain-containing protein, partial [Gemmatimonadaceae bacterium]|nr:carboxypeptidase-like regulatory domain-containing protein [Gemmatimonadaceae bacterium]